VNVKGYVARILFWALLGAAAFAQSSDGFAGSDACKTCHADLWQPFFRNPHFKSIASGKQPPDRTGCEGCHGPGKGHVEAKGGSRTIPRAFSLMSSRQVLDTCLACHSKDLSRGEIRRSVHTQSGVACNSCHSIHRTQSPRALLAKPQVQLCYDCHPKIRAQFSMPTKHRVNEGFMKCSDCHNPHGTPSPSWRMGMRPHMVQTGSDGEQPCLRCHSDKRGPFAFEHPGVRVDGCEMCHAPHGSTNTRLLKRPLVFTLCLECHNGAGSFGRQADGVTLQSPSHNMADPKYQNCTTCHVRIHGSNADRLFFR
jgi:DmsE family decaheme c-type cytochrome